LDFVQDLTFLGFKLLFSTGLNQPLTEVNLVVELKIFKDFNKHRKTFIQLLKKTNFVSQTPKTCHSWIKCWANNTDKGDTSKKHEKDF